MNELSVLALIVNDNKILSVSLKKDHNDFNFPGGKVNEGEDNVNALIREVKEETGYDISVGECILWDKEGERPVVTYICTIKGGIEGTEEDLVIKWITWEELFKGKYHEYNRKVFKEYQNRLITDISNEL